MSESTNNASCRNCGARLQGEFCHECGQSSIVVRRPARDLLNDALAHILQWDSRLAKTLKLLFFFPGRLSVEWIDGKRIRYVPPFRLYLIASFILFLLVGISARDSANQFDTIKVDDSTMVELREDLEKARENGSWFTALLLEGTVQALEDPVGYMRRITVNLPKAAFILLPVFAFLHLLVNIRRGRYLIDYLVFSLHYHAFAFSIIAMVIFIGLFSSMLGGYAQMLNLTIPVYGVIAFKNHSGQGWLKSILKGMLVFSAYSFLLGVFVALYFAAVLVT